MTTGEFLPVPKVLGDDKRWCTGFGGYVIWPMRVVVFEDWRSAVIVPMYKGKGEKTECRNSRGISLLS